jgi:hypothetical protein
MDVFCGDQCTDFRQGSVNTVANDADVEATIADVINNLGGILRRDISVPIVTHPI